MDTKKDAISNLPDEVLGNILSSLSTTEAASTSVLSKKWRNVFALVDNLDFNECVLIHPERVTKERDMIFRNFVETTLALQSGSPIKKFSLRCYCVEKSKLVYVYRWICNAVERGVLEMDVSLNSRYFVNFPCELFRSKTLVKLSLGTRVDFGKILQDVYLPSLKSLFIDSIVFNKDDLCKVLLPGCPLLEELFIRHEEFVGRPNRIFSRSIKKLSVHYDDSIVFSIDSMLFDAPNLVSLDYSDYALLWYPKVNLASLVDAKLDLRYAKGIGRPDVTDLIIGISNVETLHLSPGAVHVIDGCLRRGLVLPVFNNLVKLSFGGDWRLLPHLLKESPKLESLTIQDLNGYTRDDVSVPLNKVKALRVLGYGGTIEELKRLKSFLGKTNCLELLQVEIAQGVVVDDDGIILEIKKDLMETLLGVSVSSTCKIEIA